MIVTTTFGEYLVKEDRLHEQYNTAISKDIAEYIENAHSPELQKMLKTVITTVENKFGEKFKCMSTFERNQCISMALYNEITKLA